MSEELKLVIERDFKVPIEKVWRAWTDAKILQKWSSPHTFEVTQQSGELKVGGEWHAHMESKSLGYSGSLRGEYKVIEPPHKLVSSHIWVNEDGSDGFYSEYTMELSEENGITHMVFTQIGFESPESRDSHKDGWGETFDKLSNFLEGGAK